MIAAVVIGWPAVFASIVLAWMGITTGRAWLTHAGAIIACPFLLYVSAAPGLRWVSATCGLLLFLAAVAVTQRQQRAAALLITPYLGLCAYVAYLVSRSHAG